MDVKHKRGRLVSKPFEAPRSPTSLANPPSHVTAPCGAAINQPGARPPPLLALALVGANCDGDALGKELDDHGCLGEWIESVGLVGLLTRRLLLLALARRAD